MITFSYYVTKDVSGTVVRQYQDRMSFSEFDPDTGYQMAMKITAALDCALRALEDDEQLKKELLRTVRDHVNGRIQA